MHLFWLVAVVLIISTNGNKIIESPRETNWGDWGNWERCPFGKFAQAVQIKTEPYQGLIGDDTAANAIRLYCGNPQNVTTQFITSLEAIWGNWGQTFSCDEGHITGFQLRVEAATLGDNTATNNIRVTCSYTNGAPSKVLEADGLTYGRWTESRACDLNQRVCGLQTQVQKYQGETSDDSALNNLALECCDF